MIDYTKGCIGVYVYILSLEKINNKLSSSLYMYLC